jgi:hypothetical protein
MTALTVGLVGLAIVSASGHAARPRATRMHGVVIARADAATYVSPSEAHTNFASSRALRVGPGEIRTYLRFQVPALSPTLAVAQLQVWVEQSSPGFAVMTAGRNWQEGTLTYANAPSARGRSIESGPVARSGWQTVDVTPLVRRGPTTLVLEAVPGTATVASRRSGHAPRLRLQAGGTQPSAPIRAAFFYDWFPETWGRQGHRFSHYVPSRGFYDSGARSVITAQIGAMQYAHLDAAIVSWWGRGSKPDERLPKLLSATRNGFHWTIYYEEEAQSNPTPTAIRQDLLYLRARVASSPAYLRINGRFVVFVYAQGTDGCDMAKRWKAANTVGAYVVLKVFSGYRTCAARPDGWHQYAALKYEDYQRPYSFAISPGFFKATETTPRLARNPAAWQKAAKDMVASRARFQLVTTFNEWGEGTAVESARQWQSASGYGTYLDTLHEVLPARKR